MAECDLLVPTYPGGVDAHLHLTELVLFGKGECSRSATCGGTTTLITFAPQEKSEPSLLAALASAHARAQGLFNSDYSYADPEILDVLFEARGQKIVSIIIHAENGAIIDPTINKLEDKKALDTKYHIYRHPPLAEIDVEQRAMSLSDFIDVPILIVQVLLPAAARGSAEARFADLRRDLSSVPLPDAEGP
ncbi:D-hydantoinase [Diplocarpon rosae]|nr:D-hydantoinase [Diplocarpon rosae]